LLLEPFGHSISLDSLEAIHHQDIEWVEVALLELVKVLTWAFIALETVRITLLHRAGPYLAFCSASGELLDLAAIAVELFYRLLYAPRQVLKLPVLPRDDDLARTAINTAVGTVSIFHRLHLPSYPFVLLALY